MHLPHSFTGLHIAEQGTKLFDKAERLLVISRHHASCAFKLIKKVLTIHDKIKPSSPLSKGTTQLTLFTAFQIAIMSRKTIAQADQHIRFLCDLYSAVCPYTETTLNSPEGHLK